MKPLLVLAGGFGTRLQSIVSDVPKPLAPVCGKPFITYLIDHWMIQGVNDFIFLLHYKSQQIIDILDDLSCRDDFSNITLRVIVENTPLGTGGAILNAINHFNIVGGFFVANADTWLGSGIKQLANSKISTIAAVNVPDTKRYGLLRFEGNKITAFEEKLTTKNSGYVNSGLYYLLPEAFSEFKLGSIFSIESEVFPKLVFHRQLEAVRINSRFIDIGIPEDYIKFCKWLEAGKKHEL